MNKIVTGLLGFGMGGRVFHGPLLSGDGGFTLKSVSGRSFLESAKDYPGTINQTVDEILDDSEIELVVITTPNGTHGPLVQKALEAGKHVVVDKPFCLSFLQARGLVDFAKDRKLKLTIFQNRRWDGDFLTAKKLIQDGTLGSLVSFESNYHRFRTLIRNSWKESQDEGGGILWDLGPHLVDQAVQLFGIPHSWSMDKRTTRPGALTPDDFEIFLNYGAEKRIVLRAAMVRAYPDPRFVLHGLEGSWVKTGMDPQENDLKSGRKIQDPGWGLDVSGTQGMLYRSTPQGVQGSALVGVPGAYPNFYRQMYHSLRTGQEVPVDPESVLPVLRILEDLSRE